MLSPTFAPVNPEELSADDCVRSGNDANRPAEHSERAVHRPRGRHPVAVGIREVDAEREP